MAEGAGRSGEVMELSKSAAGSAVASVAPWALLAGGVFLALKLLEKVAPTAGAAAGGAAGGLLGGAISGAMQGMGNALGLAPDLTDPIIQAVIPDTTQDSKLARIEQPPNGGTSSRGVMAQTYRVRAVITWNKAEVVLVTLEAEEYPRFGSIAEKSVSRKTVSMNLVQGRNVLDAVMNGQPTCDVVLSLKINGQSFASSAFYNQ
jgi:hypothetical protein